MSADTLQGATRRDIALIFGMIFLTIFAGLIIWVIAQADFTNVTITGAISVEMLMGTFVGIVIAVVGFLGITRGRVTTAGSE